MKLHHISISSHEIQSSSGQFSLLLSPKTYEVAILEIVTITCSERLAEQTLDAPSKTPSTSKTSARSIISLNEKTLPTSNHAAVLLTRRILELIQEVCS